MVLEAEDLPQWEDLPPVSGMPHGCAWGLFDKDGVQDQLGTLNLLTPKKVLRAKEEIKAGVSVSLKYDPKHSSNLLLTTPTAGRWRTSATLAIIEILSFTNSSI